VVQAQNIIRFVEDKYHGGEHLHESLLQLFFSISSPQAAFVFNRSSSFLSGIEMAGTFADNERVPVEIVIENNLFHLFF
jgi:hypothetical protein